MIEIEKLICIGSNCIAADFTNSLNVREKSPVDNIANFHIWNSNLLFSGEIYDYFFKKDYQTRQSSEYEIKNYHYYEKVFNFVGGFAVVHNDFTCKRFKKSLKKRIQTFKKYYKKSQKNDSYWYIYSLNYDDSKLTELHFNQLLELLPKCCTEHLICLGIRGKNKLFKKYFRYYLELEDETYYRWHCKDGAEKIAKLLNQKYNIRINYI